MKRFARCAYFLGLHLYGLAMLPKMLLRKGLARTCACFGRGFPRIFPRDKPLIWVHAVSLGETKAVAPLLHQLKADAHILLTTATETGYAEGKRQGFTPAYLPFDLPYIIKPIVRRVAPKMVILVETDFWLFFQEAAKEVGAHLVLVNGKISERSYHRFHFFPSLAHLLLEGFDTYCIQGELYRHRFLNLGIDATKVVVTGNIKILSPPLLPPCEKQAYKILTLGSTHAPEEALWLAVLPAFPDLKVYLVPRHPERFSVVAHLLEEKGLSWGRWSEGASFASVTIILVDVMGALMTCYQRSAIAFVGGSLTPHVGGHNLMEPASRGIPVLYGPHMWGQPDLCAALEGIGIPVTETTLESTLKVLLADPEECARRGKKGKDVAEQGGRALSLTHYLLLPMLDREGSAQ